MARKPLWIAGGVIAGIIALVIIAVVVVFTQIDSIIKAAVESIGPKMTQSEVKLDKVEISTTSGEGRLSGLFIGNPKGFTTPSAMTLGEIAVKLDTSTITKDTILIKDVLIRAPEITYEYASSGDNINAIKKNVDSYVGLSKASGDKKAGADEVGKKLIIENLRIQDGKVTASAMGQQVNTGLPTIQLKDIGKKTNGATAAEVVEQVLAAIQQQVARVVQQQGLDKIGGAAKGALDSATKGVSGGTGDATKGAQDALKGILGR